MWDLVKLLAALVGAGLAVLVIAGVVYAVREFRHATRDDE